MTGRQREAGGLRPDDDQYATLHQFDVSLRQPRSNIFANVGETFGRGKFGGAAESDVAGKR